jgi:hypothetical protein
VKALSAREGQTREYESAHVYQRCRETLKIVNGLEQCHRPNTLIRGLRLAVKEDAGDE